MKVLIISTSLNKDSKSRILAKYVKSRLDCDIEFIDLFHFDLPMCDAGKCYEFTNVIELKKQIENADGVIFALPIYNYNINSSAKNVIELAGKSLSEKLIGILCSAGGSSSYMAPLSFVNSLMLDFRCLILPRFVYSTYNDISGSEIINDQIIERLELFCTEFNYLCNKLN